MNTITGSTAESGESNTQSISGIVDTVSEIKNLVVDSLPKVLHQGDESGVKEEGKLTADSLPIGVDGKINENDSGTKDNEELVADLLPQGFDDELVVEMQHDLDSGGEDSVSPSNLSEEDEIINAKVHIDTKAPIESVKAAVSKFGGIVDWRAHKVNSAERSKVVEQELERLQEEVPLYRQQAESAEQSKGQMMNELESIKAVIEDLKLNLEWSQIEERQAKQDCQIVQTKVEELEQGIAKEARVISKTQVEVARARHIAAVTDLKFVKDELEWVQKEYTSVLAGKEAVEKKTADVVSESVEMEKSAEKLKAELVSMEESLESVRKTLMEDAKLRSAQVMGKEQDILHSNNDLKQSEDDLEKLNKQIESAKDLKSKLDKASSLLKELRVELATYEVNQVKKDDAGAVMTTYIDLEGVKLDIEKTSDEVYCLEEAATSLKTELDKQKLELANLEQREGMASSTIPSLEAELGRIKSQIVALQMAGKEADELPNKLKLVSQEADEAKSAAKLVQQELKKAEEETAKAKESANSIERQLLVAQKEIQVVHSAHKLASNTIKALKNCTELTQDSNGQDLHDGVGLSLDEYYDLTKRAHEAEEQAKLKVSNALSKVDIAEEANAKSLKLLEEVNQEVEERKDAVRLAMENAEKAKEGKLNVEQELRKWRAEQEEQRRKTAELAELEEQRRKIAELVEQEEQRRKTAELHEQELSSKGLSHIICVPTGSIQNYSPTVDGSSPKVSGSSGWSDGLSPKADGETLGPSNTMKKKKKTFFPRFFMFFTRRKKQS